jgi:hypothetical protein
VGKQIRTGVKTYPPTPPSKNKKQLNVWKDGYGRAIHREEYIFTGGKYKYLCIQCRIVFGRGRKNFTLLCPRCSSELCRMPLTAKAPKKNASNKKWEQFFEAFPWWKPK